MSSMPGASLSVANGALFVREKGSIIRVQVAAPANPSGTSIGGEGRKLELKPGWKIIVGQRQGRLDTPPGKPLERLEAAGSSFPHIGQAGYRTVGYEVLQYRGVIAPHGKDFVHL
jgi:hypothetical protein